MEPAYLYMLVGATARDLLLHHVYGLPVTRATYDVDFAILVDSWEQFATVKQLFLKVPGFIDKGRDKQRLFYQQSVWSDRRRCADRGLSCEFRRTHSSEPQAEGSRS